MEGLTAAFLAPALFGAGTALTKALTARVDPSLLAGLLYVGAGAGLTIWRLGPGRASREVPLARRDALRVALVALFGGLLGPLLLVRALASGEAAAVALLLNLEAPLTAFLARLFYGETVERAGVGAAVLVSAGGLLIAWPGGGSPLALPAALAAAAAALCWALDNNLSQTLSDRDPVQLAAVKGWSAGAANAAIALGRGAAWPAAIDLGAALCVGAASYGASLVFFLMALRRLGSARTATFFALAPFVGAALAVAWLGEPATPRLLAAAVLMAAGTWLNAHQRHEHEHEHELEHEHLHEHDDHHAHGNEGGQHSHRHSHKARHRHPHAPDIHHRDH